MPDNYYPQNSPDPDGDGVFGWVVALIALFVFWPVGIFLVLRKLLKSFGASKSPQPQRVQSAQPQPAQTQAGRRSSDGTGFLIGGGITTGLFGFSLLVTLAEAIASHGVLYALSTLISLAVFTGAGLALLGVGFSRRRRAKRFRQYLGLIGRRESVSVEALAKAAGRSPRKVREDLQDMLNLGVLPTGYLDLASDRLVLSAQGISDPPKPEPKPEPEPEQKPQEEDDYAVLAEIRAVNDAIPDPVMSAKIDRIGELTGRILDYQRQNPAKAGQLRGFLNYYLPTTLKILRAYAQLDQQGVEGENISAAKARIEGMMDKVVEGFEKQLDLLFRDKAMDIASDVSVLEQMLEKDGLGQGGMTL